MKKIKKYRAVIIFAVALIFNLVTSLYFGTGTELGLNLKPMSIGEWICDIISNTGVFFAVILGCYDVSKYNPQKVYLITNNDVLDKYFKNHNE